MSGEVGGHSAENDVPVPLDPIEPTVIGPGLAAIPLIPTPWDDAEDGQCAVTHDGTVWQRRKGLWHMNPWWQGTPAEEIIAICAKPDHWAYDLDWTRKQVEDAKGLLTPIVPPATYPHSDEQCRQDSVDASGFREACRAFARLADAAGLTDSGLSFDEVARAIIRVIPPGATS